MVNRSIQQNALTARARGPRSPSPSFVSDTHLLNHPGIFSELIACHGTQLLGRAAAHGKTQVLELAANLGITDRLYDFGIQSRDDVLRRPGRRHDRKPGIEEEPWQ